MARTVKKHQAPPRFWKLVNHGDTLDEYGGSSVRIVGEIVRLAVENGVTLKHLERLLVEPHRKASVHVRSADNLGGRVKLADVRRWYERDKAGQRRKFDLDEWRESIAALRDLATSSEWPAWIEHAPKAGAPVRRSEGKTVRRVLAAHYLLAMQSEGIDYLASERKVAELANVGDIAAGKATAALLALGIIRRRPSPSKRDAFTASHYRVDKSGMALRAILGSAATELIDLAALETHPMWRHGSGVRFDVWAQIVIGDGLATVASIEAETTASRPTVRRVVASLERLQLVERLDDGTVRATSSDHRAALDAAALASGMAERARRQLERHEADRAAHVVAVIRKGGRLLAAAIRRGVRAIARLFYVDHETGEVVRVSVEREHPPADLERGVNRQHAPPAGAVA